MKTKILKLVMLALTILCQIKCTTTDCNYEKKYSEMTFTSSNISNDIDWPFEQETFFNHIGDGTSVNVELGETRFRIGDLSNIEGEEASVSIENKVIPSIHPIKHWDGSISMQAIEVINSDTIVYEFHVDLSSGSSHVEYEGTVKQIRELTFCETD